MLELNVDKKRFVDAIQNGLLRARDELYASGTLTNNRIHMQKWDYIVTELKRSFSTDDRYAFVPLDRGLFKPVMMFDKEAKTLYTVMKRHNFENLMGRKSVTKSHYIDALLDYNYGYQKEPLQMDIFDEPGLFSVNAELQINDLKLTIGSLLNADDVTRYVTIVVDFTSFALTDAKAVLCSKWLNIIESDSWSEIITPSYEDNMVSQVESEYVHESSIKARITVEPKVKRGLA